MMACFRWQCQHEYFLKVIIYKKINISYKYYFNFNDIIYTNYGIFKFILFV